MARMHAVGMIACELASVVASIAVLVVGFATLLLRADEIAASYCCLDTVFEPLQVVVAGPPGCGKGTVCTRVSAELGLVHVSTGDLLRAEVAAGSELGAAVEDVMARGELVDDALLVPIVRKKLAELRQSGRGFVLDGFPRTLAQAEAVWPTTMSCNETLTHLIVLDVPDSVVVERVAGRRVDPATGAVYHLQHRPPPADNAELLGRLVQRPDDNEETVKARVATHHAECAAWLPVLSERAVVSVHVDGNRPPDAVAAEVLDVLQHYRCKGAATQPGCSGPSWMRLLARLTQCGSVMKTFC